MGSYSRYSEMSLNLHNFMSQTMPCNDFWPVLVEFAERTMTDISIKCTGFLQIHPVIETIYGMLTFSKWLCSSV